MQFGVLGPLIAHDADRAVSLGSYKQRSLLGLLLINRNQVVPVDRILDEVWGEAPTDRRDSLHVYLSNLRRALEPGRERRGGGKLLLTRSPGYVLVCGPDDVDADVFERSVEEGRALVAADPGAASIALGEALGMWRGLPYEEFTYERWAQHEIERLTELRLHAVEARIDADLARGLDARLVSELGSLVREHPLRERFTEQLMLALYRSGRQAEALRAYQMLAERLADELGITPAASTQALEERIVMADPALQEHRGGTAAGVGAHPSMRTVRGYELRDRIGAGTAGVVYRAYQPSVGREVAIKVYAEDVADDPAFVRSFGETAQRVASLRADGIVPVYDHWREPGAAYLVERLMLGGSLDRRLTARGLEADEAASLVARVGGALAEAHAAGISHGAVRAGNVLFDSDGVPHLSDFGIGIEAMVEVGGSGTPTRGAGDDQRGLAMIAAQAIAGRLGDLPELLVGMDPRLGAVLTVAADGGYSSIVACTDAILDALVDGHPEISPNVENPYKGLRPFGQGDADDFFGRDREIERLVGHLGDPSRFARFVAIVGPSGSGKSSLVKAGLIPALRRGAVPGSASWFIAEMVPGRYPYEALENALTAVAIQPPRSMLSALTSERGISRIAEEILPGDDSQLVIVVDQLEELFTHADPATASRFLTALADAATGPGRLRVVCTLRADFYDRPLTHVTFGELLRNGTEVITPMSPAGLEQAITGPADRVGVTVDRSLVAEIVADVVERPAALPLVQYALTEMFEIRDRDVITPAVYHRVGGALGALVQRAEGLFAALDDPARDAAQQVFLRLVSVGPGSEKDTRRRTLVSELTSFGAHARHTQRVLDVFGHHRLLTFDRDLVTRGPTVEISHEALLTEWDRLAGWIEDSRADLEFQRRLAAAFAEWDRSGRSDEFLLAGGLLQRLEGWTAVSTVQLTRDEQGFLARSIDHRKRLVEERAAADAQREAAMRRSRRRTLMLGVAIVLVVAVASVAVLAWRQQHRASQLAARADAAAARAAAQERAARLADQAVRQAGVDPQLALSLALHAAHATVGLEHLPIPVEEAMHVALQSARIHYPFATSPTRTAVTPSGVRGYYVVEPNQLATLMAGAVSRDLTPRECATYEIDPCRSVPTGPDARLPPMVVRPYTGTDGTQVTVVHAFIPEFSEDLAHFSTETGIDVTEVTPDSVLGWARASVDRGPSQPDIVLVDRLNEIRELDRLIGLARHTQYRADSLYTHFGPFIANSLDTSLGSSADLSAPRVDLQQVAAPVSLTLKGLVWYDKGRFAEAGYSPPSTWAGLMELSRDIVRDGGVPWCIGFGEDPPAAGRPGTDWVEALVLRHAGIDFYDAWARHEVPFDHPAVVDAMARLDHVLGSPGFLPSGRGAVASTPWAFARDRVTWRGSDACWMFLGGSDIDPRHADRLDFFVLPPLEPAGDTAHFGSGVFAVALTDRPEVREVLSSLGRGDYVDAVGRGSFLAPHRSFEADLYGPDGDAYADLKRRMHTMVRAALIENRFRFDASDLIPSPIGHVTDDGSQGAWYRAMQMLADGTLTPAEAATDVEAAWLDHEAQR